METISKRLLIPLILLNLFSNKIISQNSSAKIKNIQFGINAFVQEEQIKPYLFRISKFYEIPYQGSFGFELFGGLNFTKNWYTQIGISYTRNNYKISFPFNVNRPEINPEGFTERQHNFGFSNSFADLDFRFTLLVDERNCEEALIPQGDLIGLRYSSINTVEFLSFPFSVGRQFGNKGVSFFVELEIIPKLILSKKVDSEIARGIGVLIDDSRRFCTSQSGERIHRISISESSIHLANWNIEDKRLDFQIGFGFFHETSKDIFKMGLFYGESISPSTIVNNKKYFAQIGGIKISFKRKIYLN